MRRSCSYICIISRHKCTGSQAKIAVVQEKKKSQIASTYVRLKLYNVASISISLRVELCSSGTKGYDYELQNQLRWRTQNMLPLAPLLLVISLSLAVDPDSYCFLVATWEWLEHANDDHAILSTWPGHVHLLLATCLLIALISALISISSFVMRIGQ